MANVQVVISGIAGKFPQSDNVGDFQKNLFDKVDCVTDASCRWKISKYIRFFLVIIKYFVLINSPIKSH